MPTLQLDAIKDSELESSLESTTYVRMGWVNDIDLEGVSDADALIKVRPLLPPYGSALGAQSTDMTLRRIRIVPELGKFKRVKVALYYNNLGPNFTPTISLLRDRTFTTQKNSCFIPGTRIPILVGYEEPLDPSADIEPSPVFFNFNGSARSIQITVLQYGRPTAGAQDYVNYVNDAPWPTGGTTTPIFGLGSIPIETASPLPIGYWRLASYGVETNKSSGMSLVSAEAISQVTEDWSEVGLMRNELTGKFPFAGISAPGRLNIYNEMMAEAYSHGIIYPTSTSTEPSGIIRVGPYALTNFATVFGF